MQGARHIYIYIKFRYIFLAFLFFLYFLFKLCSFYGVHDTKEFKMQWLNKLLSFNAVIISAAVNLFFKNLIVDPPVFLLSSEFSFLAKFV